MCRLPRLVSMDSAFNDSRTGYGLAWTSAGHRKSARCFLCTENAPDDSCATKTRPMIPVQRKRARCFLTRVDHRSNRCGVMLRCFLRLHQSTSQLPSNPISCLPNLPNNPHEPILLVGRLRYSYSTTAVFFATWEISFRSVETVKRSQPIILETVKQSQPIIL